MSRRTSFVLLVMTLAVFAALFPAAPGEASLPAAVQVETSAALAPGAG